MQVRGYAGPTATMAFPGASRLVPVPASSSATARAVEILVEQVPVDGQREAGARVSEDRLNSFRARARGNHACSGGVPENMKPDRGQSECVECRTPDLRAEVRVADRRAPRRREDEGIGFRRDPLR